MRGGKATKDELRMINKLGLNKPRKHRNRRRGRPPKSTIPKGNERKRRLNEAKKVRLNGVTIVNKWAKIIKEQEVAANKEFRKSLMI